MPPPSCPRLLVGFAAIALAGALSWAPVAASADLTPAPTPTRAPDVSAAATPSGSPEPANSTTASPSATASSPADTESATPVADDDETAPSTSPSPDDAASQTTPPTSGGDGLGVRRAAADALAADAPAAEDQVEALAEGPGLTLVKTASPTRVSRVGQVVSYRFTATNVARVPVTGVEITDELEGLSALTCTQPQPATLLPDQVLRCTATLSVTQADLDFGAIVNVASVFGEAGGGDPENPVDDLGAVDDAAVQVDQAPSIGLTASVSPTGTADRGDRLRYRATATNTGNVTLSAARITSSLDDFDLDCEPSARATLAPGATLSCSSSYRVSSADARRGRVTNELTARAERPFGDPDSRGDDVTDEVRLRVAVTRLVDAADGGLANTGGPALPLGLAGLAAVAGGAALVRRARRP